MTPDTGAFETTSDWLLNETISLKQQKRGYRAGLDAVLLAGSIMAKPKDKLLEAGCGAGAALLCAATRLQECRFSGLERDGRMLALAKENVTANGLEARVEVFEGDVSFRPDDFLNAYDHVFANPPYFDPDAIQTLGEGKDGAYLADVSLEVWLKFMLHAVRPKGRVTLVHRAAALGDILAFMLTRFGEIQVMPIKPYAGQPAKRILVTARKSLRKGDVVLYDGLTLYDGPDRTLTSRAAALMDGAELEWR